MRRPFVLLHRYLGLTIAVFLILSGLTGAVISWDHELDELLNPHLLKTTSRGELIPTTQLVETIESEYPDVQVTYFENGAEPGHAVYFWADPRLNPDTGELFDPGFNQVYMDGVTGEILGTREWGAFWPISRETFVSFLYEFHFSLHIPEFWGTDHWGLWLLGVIALIWTFDSFVGFYLTLPKRRQREANPPGADQDAGETRSTSWLKRWQPAWMIRWHSGSTRLNFDLHRALGLWTWGLLFIIAFTAFSLNLYREVFYPVMSLVSDVTPTPIDERDPTPHNAPVDPALSFSEVMTIARQEADQRGWEKPIGSMWHARDFGVYRAEFYLPEEGHGAGGVGHNALYFDSQDGRLLGDFKPWQGTAADIFVQAQFPLHSGRILGLPGRILISIMGLIVASLSITGIVIWARRLRARTASATRRQELQREGQVLTT